MSDDPRYRMAVDYGRASVPPRSSALRFGIRAMLAITAICGLQFALMNYLGILPGLGVGLVVSMLSLTVVLFVGLVWGDSATAERRFDDLIVRLTLAVTLLFVGTMLAGGGVVAVQVARQAYIARGLHKDLGFRHRTEYVVDGHQARRMLVVSAVEAGSLCERAGMVSGDIIVTELSPSDYLEMLEQNRGTTVTVTLAPLPASRHLQKATYRAAEIALPY